MKILNLMPKDMAEIYKLLLEQGTPEEEVESLVLNNLAKDAHDYINAIHFLLCDKENCGYDQEASMEGCWSRPEHVEWATIAAVVMELIGFELHEWPGLQQDLMTMMRLSKKSEVHVKLLSSLLFNPVEFVLKIRAIIAKEKPLSVQ